MSNHELRELAEELRRASFRAQAISREYREHDDTDQHIVWDAVASKHLRASEALSSIIEPSGDEDPLALIEVAKQTYTTKDGKIVLPGEPIFDSRIDYINMDEPDEACVPLEPIQHECSPCIPVDWEDSRPPADLFSSRAAAIEQAFKLANEANSGEANQEIADKVCREAYERLMDEEATRQQEDE